MKKVFIVSGEVSGDKLGAWYLNRLKESNIEIECSVVGGKFLEQEGAKIYRPMEELNIAGVIQVLKKLRFILKFIKNLADFILQNDFDEVILVDFPGFNLRLAKVLKSKKPNLKIIYLSPPQAWIWGKWRIKKLKKYCSELIVLYPFEVSWYKENFIGATFLGNPASLSIDKFVQENEIDLSLKQKQIAIIPGSRKAEIEKLLPTFLEIAKKMKAAHPELKFVLPLAESFSRNFIEEKLKENGFNFWQKDIEVVIGEKEKLFALSKCCLAITKPGTVSLELALLRVPAVIYYKTDWLTYLLAWLLVKIKYMSLPNLILGREVFKEFIQFGCSVENIFKNSIFLYKDVENYGPKFHQMQTDFDLIKKALKL